MPTTAVPTIILVAQIGLLAIAFFARHKLQRWATKSVEYRFDRKLEELRSDLRAKEEALKAELARNNSRIDDLRSPGIQILVAKRNAVAQRQLQAIDQIWDAVGKQAQLKFACRLLQPINLDAVCQQRMLDANTKEFFEKLYEMSGIANIKPSDHHSARPYVTDNCWAAFAAYQSVGAYAVAWLAVLKSGLADRALIREDDVVELTKAALPLQAAFIEQHGAQSVFYLMDALETAVLVELRMALEGNPALGGVEETAELIRLASKLETEIMAEAKQLRFPNAAGG